MARQGGNRVRRKQENYRPAGWRKKQMEINKELEGKKITKADVDGYGIILKFDDGTTFYYDATDGGYSSYKLTKKARNDMSYGEEIATEYDVYEGLIHSKIANGIWTMRDGSEINIREMSRKHLRNTIAMLKRKEEMTIFDEEWVLVMERELNFREYIDRIVKGEL